MIALQLSFLDNLGKKDAAGGELESSAPGVVPGSGAFNTPLCGMGDQI
jgi:hypothetical protein